MQEVSLCKQIKVKCSCPKYPTVHFDEKVVKYLSGEANDYEAVCLSVPTQLDSPQFLGSPLLDPHAGEKTASVREHILDACNIPVDTLFAVVWLHHCIKQWC